MGETEQFDPKDYLDGGKNALKNNNYADLKGLDSEKIKQIALARIAARGQEAITVQQDKDGALQIVNMMNPFDKKDAPVPKQQESISLGNNEITLGTEIDNKTQISLSITMNGKKYDKVWSGLDDSGIRTATYENKEMKNGLLYLDFDTKQNNKVTKIETLQQANENGLKAYNEFFKKYKGNINTAGDFQFDKKTEKGETIRLILQVTNRTGIDGSLSAMESNMTKNSKDKAIPLVGIPENYGRMRMDFLATQHSITNFGDYVAPIN